MTILEFWFGEIQDGWTVEDRNALWFGGRADDDREIICLFSVALEEALAGGKTWETPKEALVKIILLDQMTRAAYRGTPQAFAGDPQALAICKEGLAMRWIMNCPLFAVSFFICPWSIARIWPTKSIAWCYLPACVNLWRCAPKNWILPMIMPSSTVTSLHNLAVSRTETRFWAENPRRQRRLIWRQPRTLWAGKSVTGITNEPTFRLV